MPRRGQRPKSHHRYSQLQPRPRSRRLPDVALRQRGGGADRRPAPLQRDDLQSRLGGPRLRRRQVGDPGRSPARQERGPVPGDGPLRRLPRRALHHRRGRRHQGGRRRDHGGGDRLRRWRAAERLRRSRPSNRLWRLHRPQGSGAPQARPRRDLGRHRGDPGPGFGRLSPGRALGGRGCRAHRLRHRCQGRRARGGRARREAGRARGDL